MFCQFLLCSTMAESYIYSSIHISSIPKLLYLQAWSSFIWPEPNYRHNLIALHPPPPRIHSCKNIKNHISFYSTSLGICCPIYLFSSAAQELSFHSVLFLSSPLKHTPSDSGPHCSMKLLLPAVHVSVSSYLTYQQLLAQLITSSFLVHFPILGFQDNTPAGCPTTLAAPAQSLGWLPLFP